MELAGSGLLEEDAVDSRVHLAGIIQLKAQQSEALIQPDTEMAQTAVLVKEDVQRAGFLTWKGERYTPERTESVADLETLDIKQVPNTALRGETEA